MTRTDSLFGPLATVSDVLFVYDLLLYPSSAASAVVDDEGRWRYGTAGAVTVPGYAAAPDTRTLAVAQQAGVEVDVVALVHRDTEVHTGDRMEIPNGNRLLGLGGRYRVTLVRPNPAHTRVLLRKVEGVDEPHYP